MEGEPTATASGRTSLGRARISVLVSLAAIIPVLFHRGTLIDPISLRWSLMGGVIGGLAGLGLGLLMEMNLKTVSLRQGIGLAMLVPFGAALGTYYARYFVELEAFLSYQPRTVELNAVVVGFGHSGRSSRVFADILPEAGARELQARVSDEIYSRLDAYRHPGRDCIKLFVEIGRGGTKRTELPNVFDAPLGLDRLVRCHSSS